MSGITVRQAEIGDALGVAALVLSMDREREAAIRPGFVDEYAAAWTADLPRRPTWLALQPDGNPVGLLQSTLVRKLPSLRQPATAWLHVSLVYVRPPLRGQGLGERLLRTMLAWGQRHGVERYQLHTVPQARGLYERVGFGAPSERLMELRTPRSETT